MIIRFLIVFAVVLAIDFWILYQLLTSPSSAALIPVLAVALLSLIPVIALLSFHMLWRPVFSKYPPQPHGPDAVTRRFQSFSVGFLNMGFSIHATTDSEHLHLEPLGIWQLLGASPASIPWSALTPERQSLAAIEGRTARLDGHLLFGPRWCFERLFNQGA